MCNRGLWEGDTIVTMSKESEQYYCLKLMRVLSMQSIWVSATIPTRKADNFSFRHLENDTLLLSDFSQLSNTKTFLGDKNLHIMFENNRRYKLPKAFL